MLHRLVGGPVLAQADGVVCEDMDHAQLHQRGHAHRVAAVVAEGQEGAAIGDVATVQCHTVHDCGHAELAHAVADVALAAAGEVGQVRAGQVGAAAEHLRHLGRQRGQHLLRGLARGNGFRCSTEGLDRRRQRGAEVGGQVAAHAALEFGRQCRGARRGRRPGAHSIRPRVPCPVRGRPTAHAGCRAPRRPARSSPAPRASWRSPRRRVVRHAPWRCRRGPANRGRWWCGRRSASAARCWPWPSRWPGPPPARHDRRSGR